METCSDYSEKSTLPLRQQSNSTVGISQDHLKLTFSNLSFTKKFDAIKKISFDGNRMKPNPLKTGCNSMSQLVETRKYSTQDRDSGEAKIVDRSINVNLNCPRLSVANEVESELPQSKQAFSITLPEKFVREEALTPYNNNSFCYGNSQIDSFEGSSNSLGASTNPVEDSSTKSTAVLSDVHPHVKTRFEGGRKSRKACSLIQGLRRLYKYEANLTAGKYAYDVKYSPASPLNSIHKHLLTLTELPSMILWVYFSYWLVIICMTTRHSPFTIWPTAIVAGFLVGIGLNANAHHSILRYDEDQDQISRDCSHVSLESESNSIKQQKASVFNADSITPNVNSQCPLNCQESSGKLNSLRKPKLNWGMVIRFFIIPFGVSSLSGLTNSNRQNFLLVFPTQPLYLFISILYPSLIFSCLMLLRLYLIHQLKIRWSVKALLFNGKLI